MLAITLKDLAAIEDALNEVPAVSPKRTAAREAIAKARQFIADPAILDEARNLALIIEDEEDRISFDDEASTSPSDEGTFVSCWFWVPNPATEDDEEAAA